MKSIEIRDNQNKTYTVRVDPDSLKKEIKNGRTRWQIEHEVWLDEKNRIGFGHFSATCMQDHIHRPDDEILEALIKLGCQKVIAGINKESDIESVGYNITITDCTQ